MRLKNLLASSACLALLACSVKPALDIDKVERFITTELGAQTGVSPARVECPDEVYEEPGATFECKAFADDGSSAEVTVEMLGDGKVTFRVR